jgi:hypothetical protein
MQPATVADGGETELTFPSGAFFVFDGVSRRPLWMVNAPAPPHQVDHHILSPVTRPVDPPQSLLPFYLPRISVPNSLQTIRQSVVFAVHLGFTSRDSCAGQHRPTCCISVRTSANMGTFPASRRRANPAS